MQLLKQLLDFLNSLVKAWPSLVIIIGGVSSAVLWLMQVGQTTVAFSLPLSVVVIILTLALYPITKVVQSIVQRSSFEYSGLLWKPSFLGYPCPVCPIQGCGQRVFAKVIQPPPVQVVRPNDWGKVQMTMHYQYECPLHGKIDSVPNWPIDELRKKAKSIQRSNKSSTK
jgi:hypothetical protein